MLRKDDSFKVVFNPGSDKVELQGLGPASTLRFSGDTGSAAPDYARLRKQPRGNLTAAHIHSIGGSRRRQFRCASNLCLTQNLCHPERRRSFARERSSQSRNPLLAGGVVTAEESRFLSGCRRFKMTMQGGEQSIPIRERLRRRNRDLRSRDDA